MHAVRVYITHTTYLAIAPRQDTRLKLSTMLPTAFAVSHKPCKAGDRLIYNIHETAQPNRDRSVHGMRVYTRTQQIR